MSSELVAVESGGAMNPGVMLKNTVVESESIRAIVSLQIIF